MRVAPTLFLVLILISAVANPADAAKANLFALSATTLTDGKLLQENTCDGSGLMPHLTWSNPPAGTKVFLLTMDTPPGPKRPGEETQSDFNHLVVYNIPVRYKSIGPSLDTGTLGKTFKGTLGYTPPCSQGPGLRTYTFHLYALKNSLTGVALSGMQALAKAKKIILGTAELTLAYTR